MAMTRVELCPFCGGEADFDGERGRHWVVCTRCGARTRRCESPSEAVEAWNLRPSACGNAILKRAAWREEREEETDALDWCP